MAQDAFGQHTARGEGETIMVATCRAAADSEPPLVERVAQLQAEHRADAGIFQDP